MNINQFRFLSDSNIKKINEYFDPDIDFGIKQYVADYQAVYLTLDIETSLMWQSAPFSFFSLFPFDDVCGLFELLQYRLRDKDS